jgi:plastocyanin
MTRFFCMLAAAVILVLAAPVAPPAAAATHTVMMQDYAFTSASLTVRVGDTVTWMQHDTAPHDVVTTSAPVTFGSPQLSQGQSWSYTFRTPGTYAYYCSVHPDMRAQVIVQPAATPTPQPSTRASAAPPVVKQPSAAPNRTSAAASSPPNTTSTASSAAAPAPNDSPPPPSANQPAQAVTQPTAHTSTTSLDPMLLVAGLVTAVAIGCLLALTSRQA